MGVRTFARMPGGGGSAFTCDTCGRRTRYTGAQSLGSKLCPQCYELAGIENEISDGYCTLAERRATIDRLLTEIEAKGGAPRENFAALLPEPADVPPTPPPSGRTPFDGPHAAADAHGSAVLNRALGTTDPAAEALRAADARVRVTVTTLDGEVLEHFEAWPSVATTRPAPMTPITTAADVRARVGDYFETEDR